MTETNSINEGNQTIGDSRINTGKVADVVTKGNQTIVNIAFMDGSRRTVVLPVREDIAKYKDKYVICAMDSDNVTDILEIVND
ncbi:hypothetical protein [Pelosinus sp. sgz500959]|uniref:hypothetical protein n=1 Tax=Pelosinus sp. sgz500959 TaxID=3242472 RepID=UPI0036708FCD